jgi:hypothetical protein
MDTGNIGKRGLYPVRGAYGTGRGPRRLADLQVDAPMELKARYEPVLEPSHR